MPRRKPKPPGRKSDYVSLGGSSRRYRNKKTGETISRRDYREAFQLGGATQEAAAAQVAAAIGGRQQKIVTPKGIRYIGPRPSATLARELAKTKTGEFAGRSIRSIESDPDFKDILRGLASSDEATRAAAFERISPRAIGRRPNNARGGSFRSAISDIIRASYYASYAREGDE